jgi:ParB-like chromosome segregation protein Spo0J
MFPLSELNILHNFDTNRLSDNPYPEENRPRGQADLDSVVHHRQTIKQQGHIEPIWVASKRGTYTLLDGAHRIVATYLEGKRKIPAYIVYADE